MYILVYGDDLLITDKFPQSYTEMVNYSFTLKPLNIEYPKSDLGAYLGNLYNKYGLHTRTMRSKTYVYKVIKNLKKKLEANVFFQ